MAVLPVSGQTWVQNLDGSSTAPAPDWITPIPFEQPAEGQGMAVLSYELAPAPGRDGLLLSLVFDETDGGFLRVFWKSGDQSATLSENLYESIGLPNQRRFLVTQELLEKGGTLVFQSSGSHLGIDQIRWEWLKPVALNSAGDPKGAVLDSSGVVLADHEINGEPAQVPDDLWDGRIITAQVVEKPERIEQGVEFVVDMSALPAFARMECRLNGLDLGEPLILWVNGKKAGFVSADAPDIRDAGYRFSAEKGLVYRGWRKATLSIPPALLVVGVNTLQFSALQTQETAKPLALKELQLQLGFPPMIKDQPVNISSEEGLVSPGGNEAQ